MITKIIIYCLFHMSLPMSRSQLILQPIFELPFLAQYYIECSEILYTALNIYCLGAPSTRTSNFFFLIFRFFTSVSMHLPESNVSIRKILILLKHAYFDLTGILSPTKPKVIKPDCA
jgi:hypothetical protein